MQLSQTAQRILVEMVTSNAITIGAEKPTVSTFTGDKRKYAACKQLEECGAIVRCTTGGGDYERVETYTLNTPWLSSFYQRKA